MRARAAEDDNAAVIAPQTWAAWANAVLALSDTALADALRAATTALNPDRELKVVLAPLLTALADLGHAARPQPRRAAPDGLLPTVRGWLAPIAPPAGKPDKPEHARQLAPRRRRLLRGLRPQHRRSRLARARHSPRRALLAR